MEAGVETGRLGRRPSQEREEERNKGMWWLE